MEIVTDSRKVLKAIYELLNDKSFTLIVDVRMSSMAEKLKMSEEHLNLCIHYLIKAGYLMGDFFFNKNENSYKRLEITPIAIEYIENTKL